MKAAAYFRGDPLSGVVTKKVIDEQTINPDRELSVSLEAKSVMVSEPINSYSCASFPRSVHEAIST